MPSILIVSLTPRRIYGNTKSNSRYAKGNMPSVTISTTPVLIYSGSPHRIDVLVTNDSSVKCYIGPNSSIIAGNTIFLNQNDVFIDDYSGIKGYRGQLWGVTSSGTATINWWERDE